MSAHSINIPDSPYVYFDGVETTYEVIDSFDDKFHGDTLDEALDKLASSYSGLDAPTLIRNLDVRIVLTFPGHSESISERIWELNAKRKAKEAAAKLRQSQEFYDILLAAWQKEVDALNADAGDYTPEGFNKHWQALQAKKPVKPC
jgi:hypothetical protein